MSADLKPTLPGYVHGIVSADPPQVQCDGCGFVAEARSLNLLVLTCGIVFNPKLYPSGADRRRLCRECAREAGWDA